MDISNNTGPKLPPIKELFSAIKKDDSNEEIQFQNNGYARSGVKSSNSFFGFFKALFRTSADREKNRKTITQAREEIGKIFEASSDVMKKFDASFNSKLSWGSPLTKGALLRFKESLSVGDQEILEGKKVSLLEQSQSNADRCFQKAKDKMKNGKVDQGSLEISYWKQAENSYKDEKKALQRGNKIEAEKCRQIATCYENAATAYGEGKKNLAHYLAEETVYYKAEQQVLRDKGSGHEEKVVQFRNLKNYYSKAIEEEKKAENSKIAQYYSKAAKYLDAAYRGASSNRRPNDAKNLMEVAGLYKRAALLASAGDAKAAEDIAKEADKIESVEQIIQNYIER